MKKFDKRLNKLERKFKVPRIWSNVQLRRFAGLFKGDIVNVSGWKDMDKEGELYKDYFPNAKSYTITNYVSEARGFQGKEGEIFLDLEKDLPKELLQKFDVVFNHTVLEHIFDCKMAISNLCKMSKDIVVVVVPFLQEFHGDYGDYWRFSPDVMKKLFEENDFKMTYLNFNRQKHTSVYLFCIASRNSVSWPMIRSDQSNLIDKYTYYSNSNLTPGGNAISTSLSHKLGSKIRRILFGKAKKQSSE